MQDIDERREQISNRINSLNYSEERLSEEFHDQLYWIGQERHDLQLELDELDELDGFHPDVVDFVLTVLPR